MNVALGLILVLLGWVGEKPVQGVLMTFESPGYSTGDLNAQGAGVTKWTSSPNATINVGTETGNQFIQIQSCASAGSNYTFDPTNADLGGPTFVFDPDSSILDYKFKVRLEELSGNTDLCRVYFGDNGTLQATQFSIVSSGTLKARHGSTTQTLFTGMTAGTWYTVAGQLDYGLNKWTLYVNGGYIGTYNFKSATATGDMISIGVWSASPKVSFDDVQFGNNVVPEPMTLVLILSGGLIGNLRRR